MSKPAVGKIYSLLLQKEWSMVVLPLFERPMRRTVRETYIVRLWVNLNFYRV
jgi:hypothetical protein